MINEIRKKLDKIDHEFDEYKQLKGTLVIIKEECDKCREKCYKLNEEYEKLKNIQ